MNMPRGDLNSESAKWNNVYSERPENLPWFGVDFPAEVQAFLSVLDRDDFLLVTGCGAGGTADKLKSKGFAQILGTDISQTAIKIAKEKYSGIAFETLATEEIPLREKIKNVNTIDWLNLHQVQPCDKYLQALAAVSKNLCIVWIYNPEEKKAVKSYVHQGNISMHDPKVVQEIIETKGLKLKKQFNFSFTTNPNREVHEHKAVGQIYGK